MPAFKPFSDISLRTVFSKVSQRSVINIPGFKMLLIYFRTWQEEAKFQVAIIKC
uniref:Methionine aminopeptidase 2B-like n=1 Tax=Rhizophora mucronata TaxID=61149 RepID=A0A2P2LIC0_RHIMU